MAKNLRHKLLMVYFQPWNFYKFTETFQFGGPACTIFTYFIFTGNIKLSTFLKLLTAFVGPVVGAMATCILFYFIPRKENLQKWKMWNLRIFPVKCWHRLSVASMCNTPKSTGGWRGKFWEVLNCPLKSLSQYIFSIIYSEYIILWVPINFTQKIRCTVIFIILNHLHSMF